LKAVFHKTLYDGEALFVIQDLPWSAEF